MNGIILNTSQTISTFYKGEEDNVLIFLKYVKL